MVSITGNSDVWGHKYKDMVIMADYRVHQEVINILRKMELGDKPKKVLDIACGEGALSQRIKDTFPLFQIDINDLDLTCLRFQGYENRFSVNLDLDDQFRKEYDIVLAIEIIEHLKNPWRFLEILKKTLNRDGAIILSTPNINSVFDRIFFFIYGYHYYFGERGIINSGGHINMVPRWEMGHICSEIGLKIEKTYEICDPPRSWRFQLLKSYFFPLYPLMKDKNNSSIDIYIIRKV